MELNELADDLTLEQEAKEKEAKKIKEVKLIPVYDNKQRELRTITIDNKCLFQVTYDNKVVYSGKNLSLAAETYNKSGVKRWITPTPPEPKKKESKAKETKKKDTKEQKKPRKKKEVVADEQKLVQSSGPTLD